jgi:hypothetical protein
MALSPRPALLAPRPSTVVLRILLLALLLLAGSIVVGRDQLIAAFPTLVPVFERVGLAVPEADGGADASELDQQEQF